MTNTRQQHVPPLQRLALCAAMATPQHALLRGARGWHPPLSESHPGAPFTLRLLRMLERDWLVDFDDPQFPTRATLTRKGLQLATQLIAARNAAQAKASAA